MSLYSLDLGRDMIVVDITGGRYDERGFVLRPPREQLLAFFSLLISFKAEAVGHGNALGTDRNVAFAVWREFGNLITILSCPVDPSLDGPWPTAGCKRNTRMLDMHKPVALVAFPGGKGTADCVRKARVRGIKVYEWDDNDKVFTRKWSS